MTQIKPFQQATVRRVLKAFRSGRRYRRFLVADEVGLGKTVVAQEVIRELTKYRQGPLVVLYLCSNLSIAAQNRRKLLEVLPEEEREAATCHVDRLTLVEAYEQPTHDKLHLYTLTPDTSIPMRGSRRRDGKQEERALIQALMERVFPAAFNEFTAETFQLKARVYWGYYLEKSRKVASDTALQRAFRDSVRKEFGLPIGGHLNPVIRQLEPLELVAHLRNALAASAIEKIKPDLVIFDEFQRFRDMLVQSDDAAVERVLGRLRGELSDSPPALLLLSATPYKLYARRSEEGGGQSSREDFFDLIYRLYGATGQARERSDRCAALFSIFEDELRKGKPDSEAARTAREEIERILSEVMARTERSSHENGWDNNKTEQIPAQLAGSDLAVYKHLSRSISEAHRAGSVPYWTSIPMPMQTMGTQYVAWKGASDITPANTPGLNEAMRNRYKKPKAWPHPRLRALQDKFPPERLIPPWMAPSCPWWSLKGPWRKENSQPTKALLFSRFRAVPQAVAATLSYDLESSYMHRGSVAYSDTSRRRSLVATEKRHALMALFHPSPLIILATDPLDGYGKPLGRVKQLLRRQIKDMLKELGVKVDQRAKQIPLWTLVARLEGRAGYAESVRNAWVHIEREARRQAETGSQLQGLVDDWDREAQVGIEVIHPSRVSLLVDYALASPGVIVGRALRRHWEEALDYDQLRFTLAASWFGLRTYLDQPLFTAAFARDSKKYPSVIQELTLQGNLESVLDEHLWITGKLRSLSGNQLAIELREGLGIKTGLFFLHPLGDTGGKTFSLRCHAAMPFVEVRAANDTGQGNGEKKLRPMSSEKHSIRHFGPMC